MQFYYKMQRGCLSAVYSPVVKLRNCRKKVNNLLSAPSTFGNMVWLQYSVVTSEAVEFMLLYCIFVCWLEYQLYCLSNCTYLSEELSPICDHADNCMSILGGLGHKWGKCNLVVFLIFIVINSMHDKCNFIRLLHNTR